MSRRGGRVAALALGAALLGCGGSSPGGSPPASTSGPTATSAPAPVARSSPPVGGTLQVIGPQPAARASELRLRATVTNYAHQSWLMPVVPLSVAQLSIVVTDASGTRMPTYPPPVPREGDDRREVLTQGASRTFELTVPMDLPPGTYAVTWGVAAGIDGAAASFTIK
jgi:hypothetical protein